VKSINQNLTAKRLRLLSLLGLIMIGGLISACSSGFEIRSDIDPSVEFSQYRTYNFFEPMGIEGGYNSPVFGEHFRASLTSELSRRGYQISDTPDFLVNVTIRADDQVSMRSHSTPYMTGHYYSRPGGAYGGSGMGVGISSGARISTEVSLFIDFVDAEKRRMVWQGVSVFEASDKVATQLRDATYTAVNKMLEEYPHTAGQ
jgi:hypothetical protein